MAAAEESAPGQGRRMRSLEDMMPGGVDEFLLGAGEIAPKEENDTFKIVRDISDNGVCELLPADPAVGGGLA